MSSNITYDDFTKLSLRVGTITSVEEIPKADKIYKLTVNLGEELGIRTLVAGIKQQYEIADLIQRQIVVLVNLEPRTIRKVTSHGMLLAGDVDGAAILLQPDTNVPNGTHIR